MSFFDKKIPEKINRLPELTYNLWWSWTPEARNLFKRLESAGPAFLLSIERHILRNFIVFHAIEQGQDRLGLS